MISGVLLAAGIASRMGRPKQLLPLEGKPMLQHVLDTMAEASLDEIVVVLGHAAPTVAGVLELPPHARIVTNSDYAAGPRSSLRAGLNALSEGTRAAVILLGDQPRVAPEAIRSAVRLFERTNSLVVRAMYDGVPGHPVVMARGVWEAVSVGGGDEGARLTLDNHPEWIIPLELEGPPPASVDTPEDFLDLRDGEGV